MSHYLTSDEMKALLKEKIKLKLSINTNKEKIKRNLSLINKSEPISRPETDDINIDVIDSTKANDKKDIKSNNSISKYK